MRSYSIDNRQGLLDPATFFERLEMVAPGYHRNKWVVESFSCIHPRPLDRIVIKVDMSLGLVEAFMGTEVEVTALSPDPDQFVEDLVRTFRERNVVVMSNHDAGV